MLLDQTTNYNRHEFKQIVAHIIYFKNTINDSIMNLICDICHKEMIGYTLVEIAQFIKINGIRLSPAAMEKLTHTWHRFDLINEDMLLFMREYCRKVGMNVKTEFYASFCKSLIKTKQFDKLQIVCTVILT